MDVTARLEADVEPARLFEIVSDLGTYPRWLDIVARAEPEPPGPGPATDDRAAWLVDLRGQLGPLRRSKRLRMVRSEEAAPSRVEFRRAETDGRRHADWVLSAAIASRGPITTLEMRLHYGGSLWVPLLDRLLSDEIERSRGRLLELAGAAR